MGNYASNSHVTAEFKSLDTSSGTITTAKIDDWIARFEAALDGLLAGRYEVPITGSTAILICREIIVLQVAHKIEGVLGIRSARTENEQQADTSLAEMAQKMIDDIVAGKMRLDFETNGATLADSSSGIKSSTQGSTTLPCFQRGVDQW